MKTPAETMIDWAEIGWAALEAAFFGALLGGAKRFADKLTRRQSDEEHAASLLGIRPGASADEVRAALRRKMTETYAHPDHGGDAEAAAKLIAARDLLLKRTRPHSSEEE